MCRMLIQDIFHLGFYLAKTLASGTVQIWQRESSEKRKAMAKWCFVTRDMTEVLLIFPQILEFQITRFGLKCGIAAPRNSPIFCSFRELQFHHVFARFNLTTSIVWCLAKVHVCSKKTRRSYMHSYIQSHDDFFLLQYFINATYVPIGSKVRERFKWMQRSEIHC